MIFEQSGKSVFGWKNNIIELNTEYHCLSESHYKHPFVVYSLSWLANYQSFMRAHIGKFQQQKKQQFEQWIYSDAVEWI